MQENFMYKFLGYPADEEQLSWHGITFEPSPFGMELFLWAHGMGYVPHQQFLNNKLEIWPLDGINLPQNASILYKKFVEKKQKEYEENK